MGMPSPLARAAAFAICLAVLLGGCIPFLTSVEPALGPNGETLTPTTNPTLLAIALMLTETRAAPTITPTPVVTPTDTPTPTATTPPPGSSERPVLIGSRITVEGAGLTVLSAKTSSAIDTVKAAEGSTFLDLEVIIENANDATGADIDYTPMYFHLQNPTGTSYQPENRAVWPVLQSGTLRPGEWVRGNVAFAIPVEQAGLRLSYSPQVTPNHPVTIWVDLSQPAVQASVPPTGPVAPAEPLPGRGQRVEASGIALTVASLNASQQVERTKAAAGRKLITLDVLIENVSRTQTPYNPEYFTVKDPDGYEYPATIIPAEALLQAGSLGQGQKVSGQVVFEVPAGITHLVVEYQPQVITGDYPQIRVEVHAP